jgi:hypothetical protein
MSDVFKLKRISNFIQNTATTDTRPMTPASLEEQDTNVPSVGVSSSALVVDIYLFIQGYIVPGLLTIGIIGNALSLVIFIRTSRRADASVQYLSTLAISDTGFIIFLGVADWLTYGLSYVTNGTHSINLFTYSNTSCNLMGFSRHIWEIASAWAIVAFTLERGYIVWFPLKRAQITSRNRALVITFIWVMAICLSLHRLILNQVYIESSIPTCFYNTSLTIKFSILLFDTVAYNYLPCVCICLVNVFILFGIRRARVALVYKVSRKENQDGRLIISLLLLSTFYVIFMTPVSASVTYYFYYLKTTDVIDPKYQEMLFYILTFLDQFSLLNYCTNFIIYGCTLPFYRKEAGRLLRVCLRTFPIGQQDGGHSTRDT